MTGPWIVAFLVLWTITLLNGVLLLGLLNRVTPVLEQAEARLAIASMDAALGLSPGTPVPDFEVKTDDGTTVARDDFLGRPWIALFLAGGCKPCQTLADDLRAHSSELAAELVIVVDASDNDLAADLPHRVVRQQDRELARAFENAVTPQAFAIDSTGWVVDRSVTTTLDQLEALARAVAKGGGTVELTSQVAT
jgi:peroxiredoxin